MMLVKEPRYIGKAQELTVICVLHILALGVLPSKLLHFCQLSVLGIHLYVEVFCAGTPDKVGWAWKLEKFTPTRFRDMTGCGSFIKANNLNIPKVFQFCSYPHMSHHVELFHLLIFWTFIPIINVVSCPHGEFISTGQVWTVFTRYIWSHSQQNFPLLQHLQQQITDSPTPACF